MKKVIAWAGVCCLITGTVFAQPASRISLDSVLTKMESDFPSVLLHQQNAESWKARSAGAKSWMPPGLSAGLMSFPYDLSMVKEKNDPMNRAGVAFSWEQMIPNQSRLNARRDYMNSMAEVEESKTEWTRNELRREAKKLYFNRYINEQKQKVLTESEAALNLMLNTAEARFSSNRSQLQSLYKARARLAELGNMKFMLSGLIDEASIGLNTLMVREAGAPFEIDTLMEPRYYQNLLIGQGNQTERSDIAALSGYIHSMKMEQEVMRVSVRPEFGFRAEHMQMFGMPNQWSVMGMMTLPLVPWSSKMYAAEVKAIDFQIRSMEYEKHTMQLMATRMSAEKLSMLRYEYGQYENYRRQIVPAYENSLQASLLAYSQNTGDLFVLLDAWEMLLMKKLEMYDRLLNILKLEAEYEYEMEIK